MKIVKYLIIHIKRIFLFFQVAFNRNMNRGTFPFAWGTTVEYTYLGGQVLWLTCERASSFFCKD
jgi:hypothetical protein